MLLRKEENPGYHSTAPLIFFLPSFLSFFSFLPPPSLFPFFSEILSLALSSQSRLYYPARNHQVSVFQYPILGFLSQIFWCGYWGSNLGLFFFFKKNGRQALHQLSLVLDPQHYSMLFLCSFFSLIELFFFQFAMVMWNLLQAMALERLDQVGHDFWVPKSTGPPSLTPRNWILLLFPVPAEGVICELPLNKEPFYFTQFWASVVLFIRVPLLYTRAIFWRPAPHPHSLYLSLHLVSTKLCSSPSSSSLNTLL